MDLDTLSEIGAGLGSDIPFFLEGGTALGFGRGTELYPLPDLASDALMIVCPNVHSSTGEAYAALKRELTVTTSSTRMNSFRAFVRVLGEVRSAGLACPLSDNDFAAVICQQHPALKSLPGRLMKLGAVHAAMTGSGSAFFALFGSPAERDRALKVWQGKAGHGTAGQGKYPAVAAEVVSRKRYQSLWRKQLREHISGDATWPPQSKYGTKN